MAHAEPLRFEDDVERLVPRHVLQAQRHIAVDRIRGHQIEPGKIGNQLQHRADLDVLEVQRQAFAGEAELFLLDGLTFALGQRFELHGKFVACLIGHLLEHAR